MEQNNMAPLHFTKNLLGWSASKLDRFAMRVEVAEDSECWNWKGYKTLGGYGLYGFQKGSADGGYAHRLSYRLAVGPIPEKWHIHHTCENRSCVNPNHLESISPQEHVLHHGRNWKATGRWQPPPKKEACIRGHELTEENRVYHKNGHSQCRTCLNEKQNEKYRRNHPPKAPATHCKRGHPYEGHNLITRVSSLTGNDIRVCRACQLDSIKRYQATEGGKLVAQASKRRQNAKLKEERRKAKENKAGACISAPNVV